LRLNVLRMVIPKNIVETPLMKQYYSVKASHPDAVLLFRVGDFYETFGEDAIRTAEILGITLTKRANGAASHVELAGFPHHALDTYLPKLVRAGQRVAICEQLEDPKLTKKIVKRGITELVTPGLTYNENVLDNRENNFLASVYMDQQIHGIAFLDISTGEFLTSQGDQTFIDKLLASFKPKEVLVQRSHRDQFQEVFGESFYTFLLEEWVYTEENARDKLQHQFSTQTLKGFGVQDMTHGIIASGAILQYLDLTQHSKTGHISSLSRIEQDHYVWLDRFTIRNLEIFNSLYEGAPTLIDVMDQTLSPMGSRLMKRWLSLPLKDVLLIRERHNMVEHISEEEDFREFLNGQIRQVGDLERIISKVAVGRVSPRELIQLKRALEAIGPLKERCEGSKEVSLQQLAAQLDLCLEVKERIEKDIEPEPPALINKGGVIAGGVSKELDELREIMHSGKDYLVGLQQREMERTGITSLKIAFNNVFGYYIEVRNTHKDKVPEEWIRKQTLVSAERYITEELKGYEEKILGAEEKCLVLEAQLYQKLVADIGQWVKAIQLNASLVARLDCLLSFAVTALDKEYCRPDVNNSTTIE